MTPDPLGSWRGAATFFTCDPCNAGWHDDCSVAHDSRGEPTDCQCTHEGA